MGYRSTNDGSKSKKLLDVVAHILRSSGRPLSSKEIASRIAEIPSFRSAVRGRTPHKTIQARLSTDIIKNSTRSEFYRYSPATFGLRELLSDTDYSNRFGSTAVWTRRVKQVTNEYVATVSRKDLDFLDVDGLYSSKHYPLGLLDLIDVRYLPRRQIEDSEDRLQLVSYAAIVFDHNVLTYQKGKYSSDSNEFEGNLSIGIGGHLSMDDRSLFDEAAVGLETNVLREIHEELYLISGAIRNAVSQMKFAGFLVDRTTRNGRNHIGLATCIFLNKQIELESRTLGIRNLHWTSFLRTPNTFHKFEIWSKYFLKALEQERI